MTNTETITVTKELTDNDVQFQAITASGADQTVELAPQTSSNHVTIIYNAGSSNNVVVKDFSGSTTFTTLAPDEWALFLPISGETWKVLENRATYNFLINGGFDFAQRQAPGTLTTITDNKYSADRWRVTRENADVQYIRVDATGETNLTSKYYGQFKKITNSGKFHICQILEGANSIPLRSKKVFFKATMKASASKTIRMAVIQLQNAGTLDTIPATLLTAFGADSTDPTLNSNLAVVTAAESKSVTTSWKSFSVSVTLPSNSKNILCAIWTDADFAANDTLSIAEAGLFYGSSIQSWSPKLVAIEFALCQRHYWKTFPIDTAPAQNTGVLGCIRFNAITAGATSMRWSLRLPVAMFATPTITFFNPSAANAQIRDINGLVDCSATAVSAGITTADNVTFSATGNAATAVGNALDVHISAEAEL